LRVAFRQQAAASVSGLRGKDVVVTVRRQGFPIICSTHRIGQRFRSA
jgi:hypothetical protein